MRRSRKAKRPATDEESGNWVKFAQSSPFNQLYHCFHNKQSFILFYFIFFKESETIVAILPSTRRGGGKFERKTLGFLAKNLGAKN